MANGGELEYDVLEENVYALPGLTEDLLDGPRAVDGRQLDLAVALLPDAADFAGIAPVDEALGKTTPLGWLVDYAINPDPDRLAPSGPYDNESEAWRALVNDFEERLIRRG
jgi:hypothetical protein